MKFTYRCVLGGYLAEETNIYLFALIFHFDFIYSVYLSISTMKTNNKYICSIQQGLWRSRMFLLRALRVSFGQKLAQMARIPRSVFNNFKFIHERGHTRGLCRGLIRKTPKLWYLWYLCIFWTTFHSNSLNKIIKNRFR